MKRTNESDLSIHTEVDDGDSGRVWCDRQLTDDRLDEVEHQLPVVASRRVVVTDTSRVVEHEREVFDTSCSQSINQFH